MSDHIPRIVARPTYAVYVGNHPAAGRPVAEYDVLCSCGWEEHNYFTEWEAKRAAESHVNEECGKQQVTQPEADSRFMPRKLYRYRVSVNIRGGDVSRKLVERVEAADPPEALRIVLGSLSGVEADRCEVGPDRRGRDD